MISGRINRNSRQARRIETQRISSISLLPARPQNAIRLGLGAAVQRSIIGETPLFDCEWQQQVWTFKTSN